MNDYFKIEFHKQKIAFSLPEMMVMLLILSIALAAATPIISKRTKVASTTTSQIPTGTIAIWSGIKASIPTGWIACDGTTSCPNLSNKFIYGSTSTIDTTGGAETVTLNATNIPAHTHDYTADTAAAPNSHSHTASVGAANPATHTHTIPSLYTSVTTHYTYCINAYTKQLPRSKNSTILGYTSGGYTGSRNAQHYHGITVTLTGGGAHTHTMTVAASDLGTASPTAINLIPPYVRLFFIRKT